MELSTARSRCLPNLVFRKLCTAGLTQRHRGKHRGPGDGREKKQTRSTTGSWYKLEGWPAGYAAGITVVLVCVLCYGNGLHGDLVHDDMMAITRNPDVRPESPLKNLLSHDFWGTPLISNNSHKSYRPVTTLTFR